MNDIVSYRAAQALLLCAYPFVMLAVFFDRVGKAITRLAMRVGGVE